MSTQNFKQLHDRVKNDAWRGLLDLQRHFAEDKKVGDSQSIRNLCTQLKQLTSDLEKLDALNQAAYFLEL